jgi:simple sugar transport system permease protein
VLFKATPLLLAGLAFDVAYRAGLFNIGVEGQAALAGLCAGAVGAALPRGCPAPVALAVALGAGAAAGAAWASVAGALRAWRGTHEVMSTLLLNRLAEALVPFALARGLGADSFRTADVVPGARLARVGDWLPPLRGSALSVALPLAVALAFAVARWQRRARLGRQLTWVGGGAGAVEAEGIDVRARLAQAMALSGALAGLTAGATVLGYKGYYEVGLGAGAGFSGIAVALLGRGRPLGLVAASLAFGTLQQAGLVLNGTVPKEISDILFGVAIVALGAAGAARAGDGGRGP